MYNEHYPSFLVTFFWGNGALNRCILVGKQSIMYKSLAWNVEKRLSPCYPKRKTPNISSSIE